MRSIVIGIDALAFAGPDAYLALHDLAEARGVDPDKFRLGLGQNSMAIASPCEDPVTMAVEAGSRLIQRFDVDPAEIGTLIVGTETGIDHSKPVAVYVHELLGLSSNCRTFETKHACYGAMAGLTASMDWIACGRARGRKALVIASDIASYGLNTPGEPTQGAGAVAILVSRNPRLVAVDSETMGDYTRQVMDFWRPLYSKYAFADGHYSIDCYLEALTSAYADAVDGSEAPEMSAACLYHVPFARMAFKAHQRLYEIVRGEPLSPEDAEAGRLFRTDFEQRVAPWLKLNAEIGNIYTGSLFLSLIDLLRQQADTLAGKELSLFSYGSGSGATYCTGRVAGTAANWMDAIDPAAELAERRRLTIRTYEAFVRKNELADQTAELNPEDFGHQSGWFYVGTRDHQRRYKQIS